MSKRVILAPKLDTGVATALRDELMEAVDDDMVLVGSAVEHLGALCLELILTAATLCQRAGHSVTIEAPSAQMIENLGRFGLTPDLLLESAA